MTDWNEKQLARLFDRYNQRYWRGRLPRYQVTLTDRFKGCRCDRRARTIYINPSYPAPTLLLHEMAHAASNGRHGPVWQSELRRLIRLGAHLKKELAEYTDRKPITPTEILGEFYDAGVGSVAWAQVRRSLGYAYVLVDCDGRTTDHTSARLLKKAHQEWCKGCTFRRTLDGKQRRISRQAPLQT